MGRFFLMLMAVSALLAGGSISYARDKTIVGYAEMVRIYPGDLEIRARIDTGANLASLHCNCITPIKRDGEDWVSFTVTNSRDEIIRLERKVHRIVKIKRHFEKSQERYVIKLGVCLGNIYKETEVSLIDRRGLKYPILIGRKFMDKDFLVDTEGKYLNPPKCEVPQKK
jgi:hypothetical protein